jgi:hypothetical protein
MSAAVRFWGKILKPQVHIFAFAVTEKSAVSNLSSDNGLLSSHFFSAVCDR